VSYKSQKALKLQMIFAWFFYFITDLNNMISINQPWLEITGLSLIFYNFFYAYAISLNANKFIAPVSLYEMKYLSKCQYWNCQFTNTLMAYMYKMLKTCNNNISVSWIKNMFYNYVYRQKPSYLIKFKCNFHFMPVCTFKLVAFEQLWHLNLQVLVISIQPRCHFCS